MPRSSTKTISSRRRNGIFGRNRRNKKASKPQNTKKVVNSILKKSKVHAVPERVAKKLTENDGYMGWYMCARQSAIWDPKEFAVLGWSSAEEEKKEEEVSSEGVEFTDVNDMVEEEPNQTFSDSSRSLLAISNAEDTMTRSTSLGKRSSLEMVRSRSNSKRHKSTHEVSFAKPEAVVVTIPFTFKPNDRVRIVGNAKKQFRGKVAKIEKYLISKDKWGLLLGKNRRIALKASCLEKITKPSLQVSVANTEAREGSMISQVPLAKQKSVDQYSETYNFRSHRSKRRLLPSMVAAIREERLDIVKALVMTNKCDINCTNGLKQNALHVACQYGKVKCAMLLIEMGVEINHMDNEERSALMIASREGLIDIVTALVNANAHVNDQDKDGMTALMHASKNGHGKVVGILLQNGACIDLENDLEHNALMVALENHQHHVAEKLMEAGIQADEHESNGVMNEIVPILIQEREGIAELTK